MENFSIILIVCGIEEEGFCRNSKMSSAYRLILCSVVWVRIPLICGLCLIAAASGSMNIENRRGESGHPCLAPLCRVKFCDISPLVLTVALGEV